MSINKILHMDPHASRLVRPVTVLLNIIKKLFSVLQLVFTLIKKCTKQINYLVFHILFSDMSRPMYSRN